METQIQKWLDANYQNYLKKGNSPLPSEELDHVVDWMRSPEAERYLARLDRVSVPAAVDLAKKWTIALNKKSAKELATKQNAEGTEVVAKLSDGYTMVKLVSKEAYQREGLIMGHCVASYYNPNNDELEIYSLRDPKNEPHCTVEYVKSNKSVDQIKGKANLQVVEKYHKYVAEFLNSFAFENIYSYDLKNISSIYFGNYIFLNNEMPKNLEVKKSLKIEMVNYIHQFDELVINGDAFLTKNRRCKKIANRLVVKGDLVIEEYHGLLRLADEIVVEGCIELVNCENLKVLADKVTAESVYVEDCPHFKQTFKIQGEVEIN